MTDFEGHTLLQVIPALVSGGAERTTLEVASAFRAAGGRSVVVSSGGGMADTLEAAGSTHIRLPAASKNPLVIAENARTFALLIEAEGASIIHARSRAPAWSALMAARQTKTPFVTTYHGAYRARSWPKLLYNSVMVRGDAVIANSQFTYDAVASQYRGKRYFDEAKMTVIPRGADLSRFDPSSISEARIAGPQSFFGTGLRVLLPGRFTAWKGHEVLIDAAAEIARANPHHTMSFVAIGRQDDKLDYVDGLRRKIDAAGLAGAFQLLPETDDMPAWIAAADVVVSASTEPEAFGRVAVEAQAVGRPIIATAHGGSLETVISEKTGLLVPPGDAEALAQALLSVNHLGVDGRREMGERGMSHARKKFTVDAMVASTLMIYRDLIMQHESEA
ncbi:MAG: glycosyltransferase family 4 protein [Pseudomonadota bacterium]